MLRRLWTSFLVFSVWKFLIVSSFSRLSQTPLESMMQPNHLTSLVKNVHLLSRSILLAFSMQPNTSLRCFIYVHFHHDYRPRYYLHLYTHNVSVSFKMVFIAAMNATMEHLAPNGVCLNWYGQPSYDCAVLSKDRI